MVSILLQAELSVRTLEYAAEFESLSVKLSIVEKVFEVESLVPFWCLNNAIPKFYDTLSIHRVLSRRCCLLQD